MSVDLRAERRTRGLLLRNVADEVDISVALMSLVERGIRRPSPPIALKIAEFYGYKIPEVWPDYGTVSNEEAA